jgi:hypothetical protein
MEVASGAKVTLAARPRCARETDGEKTFMIMNGIFGNEWKDIDYN